MQAVAAHFDDLDLFRSLTLEEKSDLAARFTYRPVEGGEVLIREGDDARDLHIVVSGRFAVSRHGGPVLAVIARGEPVGEIAFFKGGERTADVTALRDSEVLSINRADFDVLADAQPVLWRSIVLALTERLQQATEKTVIERAMPSQPRTVVLCPAGAGEVSKADAFALVDALNDLGVSAALLDEQTVRNAMGDAAINTPDINRWLSVQEAAHDLTLWLVPNTATEWTQKAVRQADSAVLITTESPMTLNASELLIAERLAPSDIRLAVQDGLASTWMQSRDVVGAHRFGSKTDTGRLARFLCGRARGLVLGGGGALCGAHVGLVFALREAGIDFDSFAGTSAGAAIGGGLALGFDRDQLITRCEDIFLTNRALKRWTVPRYGLIDATVVDQMVQKHYGLGLIEDLPFPFRAIATDLSDNHLHEMTRGPLWQAVRASCSIPVLLPPFIDADGRILVDGGITDNLPVNPIRASKRGPNLAIMLGQARWRRASYAYDDYPTRGALLREQAMPWKKPPFKAPRLGQIMTRSMLLASDAASQEALNRADLIFHPPLPKGMGITDWKRFKPLEKSSFEWAKAEIDRRLSEDPAALDAFL